MPVSTFFHNTPSTLKSCLDKAELTFTRSGGLNNYLNVASQIIKAFHKFTFRQIGDVAAQKVGNLSLAYSHALACVVLGQLKATDNPDNLNGQTAFNFQFFRVGKAKIREYVAVAVFNGHAVKGFAFHPDHS
jgi:hypothetical protein